MIGGKKNLLLLILFGLFILVVVFKITGLIVSQTTPSSVNIDEGISVIYDSFDGEDTTNFINMNDTKLQSINNMILHNDFGKILFLESINLTPDGINGVINLDTGVRLTNNRLSSNLSSLSKPAFVYFYNLNLNNPRILHAGTLCTTCEIVANSGVTLIFRVNSIDSEIYSAEEIPPVSPITVTPTTPSDNEESSSGRTPRYVETPGSFQLNRDYISITLEKGQQEEFLINVRNTGRSELNLNVALENLEGIATVNQETLHLRVGETKTIMMTVRGNELSTIAIGSLIVVSGVLRERIPVVVQLKGTNILDDVLSLDLKLLRNKKFLPGEVIPVNITMKNLGSQDKIYANVSSKIYDEYSNLVYSEYGEISFEDILSLEKDLKLPDGIDQGKYIIVGGISMGNLSKESFESIDVVNVKERHTIRNLLIAAGIIFLFLMIKLIMSIVFRIRVFMVKRELAKENGNKI